MSEPAQNHAQSPLVEVDLNIETDTLYVKEIPFLGHVNLRGKPDDAEFMAAAKQVLGGDLPVDNNTFVTISEYTVLWYGPEEWLIITSEDQQSGLVEALNSVLGNTFAAVTDVSGGNTVIEVRGDTARELLVKGTPLDLHPSMFNVGQCAQTVFAHAGMTIYQYDEMPGYRLIIRRSFADYLVTWMLRAAQ